MNQEIKDYQVGVKLENEVWMRSPKCPSCKKFNTARKYFVDKFWLYFCSGCGNGFTYPVPQNLKHYYPQSYWTFESFLATFRSLAYHYFQRRRLQWVGELQKSGNVLDVGAGEAEFGRLLGGSYKTTSIEAPFANIANKKVLTLDFLSWNPRQKFDVIVFWESLEHTQVPDKYIEKAYQLLASRGFMLVEYPRFGCLESKVFGRFWHHLDLPRHLAHFTDLGLKKQMLKNNLNIIDQRPVFAPEYAIVGFAASVLNFFRLPITNLPTRTRYRLEYALIFILLMPLLILASVVEALFFMTGQSPIGLIVGRKRVNEKG